MILVLRLTLLAVVIGDFLLLCVAVLLFLILRRHRARGREPETPRQRERESKTARKIREDAEAWRRLQNYSANDAYGIGGGG